SLLTCPRRYLSGRSFCRLEAGQAQHTVVAREQAPAVVGAARAQPNIAQGHRHVADRVAEGDGGNPESARAVVQTPKPGGEADPPVLAADRRIELAAPADSRRAEALP